MITEQTVYGVWVADYNDQTDTSKYLYQLDPDMISCGWSCWADSRESADEQARDAGIIE